MFPSIFKEITRRPEDNGKKMVSKKKFINYKNHFEGGGGLITIILYSLRISTCIQYEVHNLTRLFCYNNTKAN